MSPGEFEEKMRWIFSFFDKDGDGVVTVDELKELLNEIKDKNNLNSAGIPIYQLRLAFSLSLLLSISPLLSLSRSSSILLPIFFRIPSHQRKSYFRRGNRKVHQPTGQRG